MSFITPFFLSSVQKQLQPSSAGSASADAANKQEEIYHDGHGDGKSLLFQTKGNKVSLNSLNMAPIKSKVFDMLSQFAEANPSAGPQVFRLPDEQQQT